MLKIIKKNKFLNFLKTFIQLLFNFFVFLKMIKKPFSGYFTCFLCLFVSLLFAVIGIGRPRCDHGFHYSDESRIGIAWKGVIPQAHKAPRIFLQPVVDIFGCKC
jgi:hypothetical protein